MKEGVIVFLAALTAVLIFGAVIGLTITGFVPKSSTLVIECTDSEETPYDIYEKGIIDYKTTSINVRYIDTCHRVVGLPFLIEYSCDKNNKIDKTVRFCRYGCGNGRCLRV